MELVINSPINLASLINRENPYGYFFIDYLERVDYQCIIEEYLTYNKPVVLDIRSLDFNSPYANSQLKEVFNLVNSGLRFKSALIGVNCCVAQIDRAYSLIRSVSIGSPNPISLWITYDQNSPVVAKELPNIRGINVDIVLKKQLEGVDKQGRLGILNRISKATDFEYPYDFSNVKFHLLGIWSGSEELEYYSKIKDTRVGSLITSYPLKLGLRGRKLTESKPYPKDLNFTYESLEMYSWAMNIVDEVREWFK